MGENLVRPRVKENMEPRTRYETPVGSFDSWDEAAQRCDQMDMDPALCITVVYPPVLAAWPYVEKAEATWKDPRFN